MNKDFKPHITEHKKKEVEDIKRLFNTYKVAGIVNLEGLPGLMFQRLKKKLKGSTELKVTKKRLMKIAIDQLADKKNIQELKEKLHGIPALLFSNDDPFMLYKKLEKSKSSAAAKPGQKAPNDLVIEAGETPFTPGPVIGELGVLGIKTEVKAGKIHIKENKVLVKEGEEISKKAAELLVKLGIEPMKIGLNLTHTYQDGEILGKSVLYIDEEAYMNNIKAAHMHAYHLAMSLGIINNDTIKPLIVKAEREANAIADKTGTLTSANTATLLAQAEAQAETLQSKIPEPTPEELSQPQEVAIESKGTLKEEDAKKAEAIAQRILGNTPTKEHTPHSKPQEQDISKLIQDLKDKKIKGEI